MSNFKQGLSLGQFQTLRMTPQLQQAIKLLQLSRMELETAIRKELEENPMLEDSGDIDQDRTEAEVITSPDDGGDRTLEVKGQGELTPISQDQAQDPRKQDEFDWESYLDPGPKLPTTSSFGDSEEIMNYENIISASKTLYDHLIWQLNLHGFNEEEFVIAAVLLSYVDDDGYIKTPFEEIAQSEGVTVQELEEILPFVQEFDPPGIGARTLQECLLIQAKHLEEDTHDIVHLVNHHLKDLEKKNYEGIAKAMNKKIEDVIDMCKIIYDMDPKPGRAFMVPDTQYITPDVYVYPVGDDYVVALNEDGLPRLRVSNFYKNALKNETMMSLQGNQTPGLPDPSIVLAAPMSLDIPAGDPAPASAPIPTAQDYIKDKLRAAVWLIKSIHQRQRTIYKVTESIVKHQREFFDKGPAFIKPMILRDIANDVGIHESTVSRVTTNKYVHTPRGIFELKYFFNSGISTDDGDALASESVKLKIKDLVAAEDVKNPLSDQKLVDLLKKDGINIARRTVAKYRDVLGILPSSRRKKYF